MTTERVHSLDAARALLLLLGIPFHVATISLFSMTPPSEAMQQSILISPFMSFVHSFRMFAFFLLSGFFSALIISRRGRPAWLKDRVSRLGFPLLVGLLTIGPLQFLIHRDVLNGEPSGLGPLPISVDQMWFLVVLLLFVMTLYLIPLEKFATRPTVAKAIQLQGWQGLILMGGLAILGLGRAAFVSLFGDIPGMSYINNYIYYVPAFAIGAAVCFNGVTFDFFRNVKPWQFVATPILSALAISLDTIARPALGLNAPKTLFEKFLSNGLELPLALLISMCFFAILERLIRRDYAVVRFMVAGAMAIYLFHVIWVMLIARALLFVALPGDVEWMLGSLAVLGLSTLCFLIVRQSAWLSAAFSGTPLPIHRPKASVEV